MSHRNSPCFLCLSRPSRWPVVRTHSLHPGTTHDRLPGVGMERSLPRLLCSISLTRDPPVVGFPVNLGLFLRPWVLVCVGLFETVFPTRATGRRPFGPLPGPVSRRDLPLVGHRRLDGSRLRSSCPTETFHPRKDISGGSLGPSGGKDPVFPGSSEWLKNSVLNTTLVDTGTTPSATTTTRLPVGLDLSSFLPSPVGTLVQVLRSPRPFPPPRRGVGSTPTVQGRRRPLSPVVLSTSQERRS